MKYLSIVLLLILMGCATNAYRIEDVNVGDTLTAIAPNLNGCNMVVDNIVTRMLDNEQSPYTVENEIVCGKLTCGDTTYSREYVCLTFDAFKSEHHKSEVEHFPADRRSY